MNYKVNDKSFKKLLIAAIIVLPACLSSCKKNDPITPPAKPLHTDVYVAGYSSSDKNTQVATYWKNGDATHLGDNNSVATNIAVQNSDIYVVGFNDGKATCWKNGSAQVLTDNAGDNSYAWGIALSGTDVYVAGTLYLPTDGSHPINIQAVYWKNGTPVIMNTVNGYANSIDVQGSDVYIGGDSPSGYEQVATYWKDGVRYPVADTLSSSYASAITVSGNDVYLSGYVIDDMGNFTATYWKNGVAVSLQKNASATAIIVKGTDVYVAVTAYSGNMAAGASFYKNGSPIDIATGNAVGVNSIAVAGNDVYLAGLTSKGAAYWKDSAIVQLSSNSKAGANAIALAQY